MIKNNNAWYATWFNTPYYHILYKNRNDKEAQLFMDNLTAHLALNTRSTILDLACGKGRHSVYLNSLGYKVTGVDLSEQSIAYAKQFENDSLSFDVHDMTKPYKTSFDAIFNLFTSFGYFEDDTYNLETIKAIKSNLKPDGFGVIDFLNTEYVIDHLVEHEQKIVDGICFNIKRHVKDGYIVKDISFTDNNTSFSFQERVRAFRLDDFEQFFKHAGITLVNTFGNYNLKPYKESTSTRLILIFK